MSAYRSIKQVEKSPERMGVSSKMNARSAADREDEGIISPKKPRRADPTFKQTHSRDSETLSACNTTSFPGIGPQGIPFEVLVQDPRASRVPTTRGTQTFTHDNESKSIITPGFYQRESRQYSTNGGSNDSVNLSDLSQTVNIPGSRDMASMIETPQQPDTRRNGLSEHSMDEYIWRLALHQSQQHHGYGPILNSVFQVPNGLPQSNSRIPHTGPSTGEGIMTWSAPTTLSTNRHPRGDGNLLAVTSSSNGASSVRTPNAQAFIPPYQLGPRAQSDAIVQPISAQTLQELQSYKLFLLHQQLSSANSTAHAMPIQSLHPVAQQSDTGPFSLGGTDMRAIRDLLAVRGVHGVLNEVSKDRESRAMLSALMPENSQGTLQGAIRDSTLRLGGIPLHLPAILAHPDDEHSLTAHQYYLRRQAEVFEATAQDLSGHKRGRNKLISVGQVGVRCRHCAHLPVSQQQRGSVYFPHSVFGIYQATQNMSSTHLQCGLCVEMPESVRATFVDLIVTKNKSSTGGRQYWAESAKSMGLVDTEAGIYFIRNLPSNLQVIYNDDAGRK